VDWLTSLYPQVRHVLEDAIPGYWPEMRPIFDGLFAKPPPLLSVAILPLICCRAVNGDPKEAVPISSAILAAEVSLRIFDDLEDKDRPNQLWDLVGEARAWNLASAIHILSFEILSRSSLPPDVFRAINQLFIEAFFKIAAGQERDLAGPPETIEEYWRTMELKTATAYSVSCGSGAMVATDDPELIDACLLFGHHVGLAIQIFNDMEAIWDPQGMSDLDQEKITLPLMYGLSFDHAGREELRSLMVENQIGNQAERVKQILEEIDTRRFLIWAALNERDEALAAIKICPDAEGREGLESYITSMFGDLQLLVDESSETPPD
jgi:geranylgeranyl diphosphate synthase type I